MEKQDPKELLRARYATICEVLPESHREMALDYILEGHLPNGFMLSAITSPYSTYMRYLQTETLYSWGEWLRDIPALCCGGSRMVESWVRMGGIYGYEKLDRTKYTLEYTPADLIE